MTTERGLRAEYQEQAEAQLRDWEVEIVGLGHLVAGLPDANQLHYRTEVEKVQGQQEMAEQQLRELEAARPEAWDELRLGLDEALDRLRYSLDRIRAEIRKQHRSESGFAGP
jgi:hypothetical protein